MSNVEVVLLLRVFALSLLLPSASCMVLSIRCLERGRVYSARYFRLVAWVLWWVFMSIEISLLIYSFVVPL